MKLLTHTITVSCNRTVTDRLIDERDTTIDKLNECMASKDTAIKSAERNARRSERQRQYYATVASQQKSKADHLSTKVTSLTNRAVSAEVMTKKAERQVNRSTRRSMDVMNYTEHLQARIQELEDELKEKNNAITDLMLEADDRNQRI